jgi:hypothetical protein
MDSSERGWLYSLSVLFLVGFMVVVFTGIYQRQIRKPVRIKAGGVEYKTKEFVVQRNNLSLTTLSGTYVNLPKWESIEVMKDYTNE